MRENNPQLRSKQEQSKGQDDLKEMSFLDHLDELRSVLIQSLLALFALAVVCWFFSASILEILLRDLPLNSLYFNKPIEAFMIRLKISFVLGAMLAFPFIIFKIWSFVSPGLFANERRRIYPFVVVSSILFYMGVIFCYMVLIPFVITFLLKFGTEHLNPLLSVSAYFAFISRMCFTFGIVFQIPIVVMILSMLGLVTPRFLLKQWRYAVLLVFVGSAVLTPPDVISQVMMALPVLLLYIGSVLVAHVTVRKRSRED